VGKKKEQGLGCGVSRLFGVVVGIVLQKGCAVVRGGFESLQVWVGGRKQEQKDMAPQHP